MSDNKTYIGAYGALEDSSNEVLVESLLRVARVLAERQRERDFSDNYADKLYADPDLTAISTRRAAQASWNWMVDRKVAQEGAKAAEKRINFLEGQVETWKIRHTNAEKRGDRLLSERDVARADRDSYEGIAAERAERIRKLADEVKRWKGAAEEWKAVTPNPWAKELKDAEDRADRLIKELADERRSKVNSRTPMYYGEKGRMEEHIRQQQERITELETDKERFETEYRALLDKLLEALTEAKDATDEKL
jgi:chromosome segregation ATPase